MRNLLETLHKKEQLSALEERRALQVFLKEYERNLLGTQKLRRLELDDFLELPEKGYAIPSLVGFEGKTAEEKKAVMDHLLRQLPAWLLFSAYGDHRPRIPLTEGKAQAGEIEPNFKNSYGGYPFPLLALDSESGPKFFQQVCEQGYDTAFSALDESVKSKHTTSHMELGSSTGATLSTESYQKVIEAKEALIEALDKGYGDFIKKFNELSASIDDRLLKIFGLENSGAKMITSLSGTEAQLVYPLLGVTKQYVFQETGTGTSLAASGLPSSVSGWRGNNLDRLQEIAGNEFYQWTRSRDFEVRQQEGPDRGRVFNHEEQLSKIKEALTEDFKVNSNEKIGINLTSHLKTGEATFNFNHIEDFLKLRDEEYRDKDIVLIVDAAQMRLTEEQTKFLVEKDVVVSVTGSKFPGGPIFSNKVILSQAMQAKMRENVAEKGIPKGFNDYFTQSDFASVLGDVQDKNTGEPCLNVLPDIPNVVALLKWAASIDTMKEFYSYDKGLRNAVIQRMNELTAQQLSNSFPQNFQITEGYYTSVHKLKYGRDEGLLSDWEQTDVDPNSILAFHVSVPVGKEARYHRLTKNEHQKQYCKYINQDMTGWLQHLKDNESEKYRALVERLGGEKKLWDCFALEGHWGQAVQEDNEDASIRFAPSQVFYNDLLGEIQNAALEDRDEVIAQAWHNHMYPVIIKSGLVAEYFADIKDFFTQ